MDGWMDDGMDSDKDSENARTSVNHAVCCHLRPARRRLLLVDPIRLEPVIPRDEAERDRAGDRARHLPAEPRQPEYGHGGEGIKRATHSLNSSENGSSLRNVQG